MSAPVCGAGNPACRRLSGGAIALIYLTVAPGFAQNRDPLSQAASGVPNSRSLTLTFEQKGRYEIRTGTNFGSDPDIATGLIRTRVGLNFTPVSWLKLSGMAQDSRAPWYGDNAPSNVRDPLDWHEGYIELFPARRRGFGLNVGRMMLNYGEGRLIGTPQWGNLARTYDQARMYWRSPRMHLEFLAVSPVKVRIGEFNFPVLGDRVWGTYNSFPNFYKTELLEFYVLRRDQNRPGGYTGGSSKDGTDKIGINTYGFRLAGPLASGIKYSLEAALQRGKVGPAHHLAGAWFASLNRRWTIAGRPLDILVEYKFASGTANPSDPLRTSTFDQLYAANHDKFGHQDLFGWRNMHNPRAQATYGLTKSLAINFMYSSIWLANVKDSLYNLGGRPIVRSPSGTAGRHVGQDADVFGTYKYRHFQFGAGYGYLFPGEFVRKTTPGIAPTYLYVFHTYTL